MAGPLKITLDTDAVRDVWDNRSRRTFVDLLFERARSGLVDLAVTRHIEEDVPESPLADRIRELPELGVEITGGVFVVGVSLIGSSDGLGSAAFYAWWRGRLERWRHGEPPLPGETDYHHLHAHFIGGRDIFVTWDKAILGLAPELLSSFEMRVMTPESAIFLVDSIT